MSVAVHHVVEGPDQAPTVVLAGSLGSDLTMWQPQVPELVAAGWRVVRYDHRGHGGSPVPPGPYSIDDLGADAVALLDTLGAAAVHWVGLSLGGMVGMWLAARHPRRVDRLVLCCTSARLGPPTLWAERAALVRADGTGALAPAAVDRWLTTEHAAANPDLVARLRAMVAAQPAEGYAACCAAIEHLDLVPLLPAIAAPTLVIAGAQDPATPPEHARRIGYSVPGARLAVVDHAAHLGNLEQPAEFSRLILEHLAGATPSGTALRRAVLGDDHVDAALADTTEFTAPLQRHLTDTVWGALWTRDGLDRRTRCAVTLGVLAALRCHDELAMHVRGALRNGLTPQEIGEVLLHTSGYAGLPAARSAFAVARRVLDELEPEA